MPPSKRNNLDRPSPVSSRDVPTTGIGMSSMSKRMENIMRKIEKTEMAKISGGQGFLENIADAISGGIETAGRTGSFNAGWNEFKRRLND